MKCSTVLSIAALGALTACQSPGGLAQNAPAWTAVYRVPYDTMANCLVERERQPWVTVTPSLYPAERRATVAVTARQAPLWGYMTSVRFPAVTPKWPIEASTAAPAVAREATPSRKPIAAAIPLGSDPPCGMNGAEDYARSSA